MARIFFGFTLAIFLLWGLASFQSKPMLTDYDKAWHHIDSLIRYGHLRTAYKEVRQIEQRAWESQHLPHWVKAIKYRTKLEVKLHDDEHRTALRSYYAAVAQAPPIARAVLHTMLANHLASFLQYRAWELAQRSHNPNVDSLGIHTWTLPYLVEKIDQLLNAALTIPQLAQAATAEWLPVCTGPKETIQLRPTLLDIVAARSTAIWRQLENYVPHPPEPFELKGDALFDDIPQFVDLALSEAWQPTPLHRATIAYQQWLRHRLTDSNFEALLDADLQRLEFMYLFAQVSQKDSLYLAALTRWEKRCLQRRPIATVWAAQARYHFTQGQAQQQAPTPDPWQTAVRICRKAQNTHPDTWGAEVCAGILAQIEAPALQAEMDQVWIPDMLALVRLEWRNIKAVHAHIIRFDEDRSKQWHELKRHLHQQEQRAIEWLKQLPTVYRDSWELPGYADWRQHTTELPMPALPSGKYVLLLEAEHAYGQQHAVYLEPFQVSAIAWVNWRHPQEPDFLYLLHRDQGYPLFDARVELLARNWQTDGWSPPKLVATLNPDKYGQVQLPQLSSYNSRYLLRFIWRTDTLEHSYDWSLQELSTRQKDSTKQVALILLDRPIYRPGQVVHYKVILYQMDKVKRPTPIPHQNVEVALRDANWKEQSTHSHTTNTFGSAAGQFTLPEGKLTGSWSLHVRPGNSSVHFRVEDYKRPRFEVKLAPPKQAIRLGDVVHVQGSARAYGDYPISNAQVRWQIERTPDYRALSWMARRWLPQPKSELVAQGRTHTDANGQFEWWFEAIPPLHTNPQATYRYRITATVTDGTGESHRATLSLHLGARALHMELQAPEKILAAQWDTVGITLRNQADQPLRARVVARLHQLKLPPTTWLPRPWSPPDRPVLDSAAFRQMFPQWPWQHENEPHTWPIARTHWEIETTGSDLRLPVHRGNSSLPPGVYRLEVHSTDPFGQPVKRSTHVWVLAPDTPSPLPDPLLIPQEKIQVAAGQTAHLQVATSLSDRPALVILEQGDRLISKEWVTIDKWARHSYSTTTNNRGGLQWTVLTLLHNRFYLARQYVAIPWADKQLKIRYGQFRDKLQPGQPAEWILRIEGADGQPAHAEMVATLYDASLEAFASHRWPDQLWPTYGGAIVPEWGTTNQPQYIDPLLRFEAPIRSIPSSRTYLDLMSLDLLPVMRDEMMLSIRYRKAAPIVPDSYAKKSAPLQKVVEASPSAREESPPPTPPSTSADQAAVVGPALRTQLDELVFFKPQLTTDAQGRVTLHFRMKEAMTKWRFRVFAHTQALATAYSEREVITSKELFIVPHPPRFLREGDRIEFTAKVVNRSDKVRHVNAALQLVNGVSGHPVYKWLDNPQFNVEVEVPAQGSRDVSWWFEVPAVEEVPFIEYTVEVSSGPLLDAERAALPVLPNRMLVTETRAISIKGGQTRQLQIDKLRHPPTHSLKPVALTLEFTANPAWLAIKSLPYLMEYPHECSEQLFSRFYANALAAALANSQPRIREVFAQWQKNGEEALSSPLSQNETLKNALLEETPWVLAAESETAQRQRLALLFDLHKMAQARAHTLQQLCEAQHADGGWPWFKGGYSSWFITQYIVEGFGHLRKLEVLDPEAEEALQEALRTAQHFLQSQLLAYYHKLMDQPSKAGAQQFLAHHLTPLVIHHLYTHSFWADQWPESAAYDSAYAYFLELAHMQWHAQSPYLQGMIALVLYRNGQKSSARTILQSLRERAIRHEEMGMYWKHTAGWQWHQHPIETHSLLLEAFAEIDPNPDEIAAMKTWLLQQKRTQAWPTTKATVEAIYALLAHGDNWLMEIEPLEVSVGDPQALEYASWNEQLRSAQAEGEAGTGTFQVQFAGEWLDPALGQVQITNPNTQLAWGATYFQYYEQLDRIEAHSDSSLRLTRQFFQKERTAMGHKLVPLRKGTVLQPGDEVVSRIVLHSSRAMDYVHLKDMRASGLEPIQVLSGYYWQNGLSYYQSTRDLATHFFIEHLPKGTFVLEYTLRAAHRGTFQTGISSIQCMYAPEFSSHSQGDILIVK